MLNNYERISLHDIKALYRPGPQRHWFDDETIAFFKSVFVGEGIKTPTTNYFITSETNPSGKTAFSIRAQDVATGNIDTLGRFHSYPTATAAEQALAAHLSGEEVLL